MRRRRRTGTRPPRVVHLTTVHPWDDVRIYHKMCRSLSAQGWHVSLVAPVDAVPGDAAVEVVGIPRASGRFARLLKPQVAAWRAVRRLDPDLVHFHDPELLFLGAVLKLQGRAVIYDAHEDIAKQIRGKFWIPRGLRLPLSIVVRCVETVLAFTFDHVVTATAPIRLHFRESRSTVIHNFPSLEEFPADPASSPPRTREFVSYVGGLTEVRGIAELVNAIEHVRSNDVRLALAGKFAPAEFEERVRALPGWKKTAMFGWLGRDEVADLLSRSVLGLVILHPTPNHLESMPIKMFEYMAAGIPSVVSDFEHFRVLGGPNALYVDPLDPNAIADAIDWILANPDAAEQMGARGRQLVEGELNWEVEAERLGDVYRHILGAPHAPSAPQPTSS
ncbi:MAG: glycosyltransferase family 4 protein [Ilumatobacter sp.]|nr:glycosyltransferase family 4 protein [Ilumatobacter sp.]